MSCQKRCVCWGRISALITACYLREGANAQLGACGEGAGSSCTPTLGTWRLAAYGHHIPCPPPCVGFLLSQPPGGGVYKFSTKLCSQCQVFSRSACKIKACCKPCVVICYLCPAAAGTDLLLTWLSRNLKVLERAEGCSHLLAKLPARVWHTGAVCLFHNTNTCLSKEPGIALSLPDARPCTSSAPAAEQQGPVRAGPLLQLPHVCLGTEQGCSVVFFFFFSPFPFHLSQAAPVILYCGHSPTEQGDEVLSTACAKACFGIGRGWRVLPS